MNESQRSLAHIVFFTLHDAGDAACEQLVAACKKYLSDHPGTLHLSAGRRAPQLDRPVNDKTFDVSLHLVFESLAAHDAYQAAPRHDQFIAENKPNWKEVRVFDSWLG